ncbi:hypothetical protein [uncultured Paraglaciecola sp.]|uniref:hypothetical protein n=1 Tax=uncultured Paraglaciecola sp. TaxID=1765024 RepID=UPI0030DBD50D|tara:strand:+ start:70426 stop:71874 length:1449 start_codon:yes stop_codon:yes gene_type:complete
MSSTLSDSQYTTSVQTLVKQIQNSSAKKDSLFELAALYFTSSDANARVLRTCQENLTSTKEYLKSVPEAKRAAAHNQVKKLQKELHDEKLKQLHKQQQCYKCIASICINVLKLTEGNNQQQTNTRSAKLLATLFMLSSTEGKNRKQMHQLYKPLYKAVLALRLLDKMLAEKKLSNNYIVTRFKPETRFSAVPNKYSQFQLDVAIPVIIAAITQDIGMQHVEIQRLLKGADGSIDEFRVLDKETRIPLLIMNHEQTQDFITNGIGISVYEGDDLEKKIRYEKKQNNRLKFVLGLLVDAVKPSEGSIGNIIKIPQIYSSFILSTKPEYHFQDLPKVITILNNSAKNGAICTNASQCFINLVGHFPLGFGIIYVQNSSPNEQLKDYFYGIVTRLNPQQPTIPTCRKITEKGEEGSEPKHFALKPENNLFYPSVQKKLENLTEETLAEIHEVHIEDLGDARLPSYVKGFWNPYRYFSIQKHQNLWS